MAVHRPPCMSDQEHNVVSLIREEVDDDYLPDRWLHEREEEERLVVPDLTDWAPGNRPLIVGYIGD